MPLFFKRLEQDFKKNFTSSYGDEIQNIEGLYAFFENTLGKHGHNVRNYYDIRMIEHNRNYSKIWTVDKKGNMIDITDKCPITFCQNMSKILGENMIDKSLINETTEDIYDYIVEISTSLFSIRCYFPNLICYTCTLYKAHPMTHVMSLRIMWLNIGFG